MVFMLGLSMLPVMALLFQNAIILNDVIKKRDIVLRKDFKKNNHKRGQILLKVEGGGGWGSV